MAEEAAHGTFARFGRVVLGEGNLDAVVARFAERVDLAFLLAGLVHVVEGPVRIVAGDLLGFLRTGDGDEDDEYDTGQGDEQPVPGTDFHGISCRSARRWPLRGA